MNLKTIAQISGGMIFMTGAIIETALQIAYPSNPYDPNFTNSTATGSKQAWANVAGFGSIMVGVLLLWLGCKKDKTSTSEEYTSEESTSADPKAALIPSTLNTKYLNSTQYQ